MDSQILTHNKLREEIAFRTILLQAIGLQPMFRKVIVLCEIHGFTVEQAAAILGISPMAVSRRLSRARRVIDIRFPHTSVPGYLIA
jgi:DNA-directed RNA polymerase specialized sigma24 family protein